MHFYGLASKLIHPHVIYESMWMYRIKSNELASKNELQKRSDALVESLADIYIEAQVVASTRPESIGSRHRWHGFDRKRRAL